MPAGLSIIFLLLAAAGTAPKLVHMDAWGDIVKTLPALFLAVCAWRYSRPRFGLWITAAVTLGAVGDYSLANSGRAWFIAGLCAFLAGHIAYSVAFARNLQGSRARGAVIGITWAAMGALVVAAAGKLVQAGEYALIAPIAIYVAVMGVMMTLAVLHQSPTWFIGAGAVIFILSDAHIAVNHMLLNSPLTALGVSGMATYYLAQYLLVAGAIHEARGLRQDL